MKLSILDQSPISEGKTAKDALEATIELAKKADKLGFTRYWVAEHHDFKGLASSAPDIVLGIIGNETKNIRIGSGAVLLPNYRSYNIAERYNMLATLYPGRVDVGLGRSPGGTAEASIALVDNFLEKVRYYPEQVDELIHFIKRDFPDENMFSKIKAMPEPEVKPVPWMLGTSVKSAVLALERGMPYVFGHFMSGEDGPSIVKGYYDNFQGDGAEAIVTVTVICAETTEEAEDLAKSEQLWKLQQSKPGTANGLVPSIQSVKDYKYEENELMEMKKMRGRQIVGNPEEVRTALERLRQDYEIEECMIVTITHSYEARMRSYELLADVFELENN